MEYQCYYENDQGERCLNEQDSYWCSDEHKNAWQQKTYGLKKEGGKRRPTIAEMQKRLKEMARDAHVRDHTEESGQIRI